MKRNHRTDELKTVRRTDHRPLYLLLLPLFLLLLSTHAYALDLNYWIEPDASGNPNKVWVRIPSIPANSTVTIYARKESGFSPNGEAVFDFFRDFSEGITGVSTRYGSCSYTQENGMLKITQTGTISGFDCGVQVGIFNLDATGKYLMDGLFCGGVSAEAHIMQVGGGATPPYNAYSVWGTQAPDTANYWYWADDKYDGTGTTCDYVMAYLDDFTAENGAVTLGIDNDAGSGKYDYWKWVRIRKYAPSEPTISVSDKGAYYEITISNPNSTDLTDFQISIPASDLSVTSTSESIHFQDVPFSSLAVSVTHTPTEQNKLALDPENGINEVNVTYTATITAIDVDITYWAWKENGTIVEEGNTDINTVTLTRTYTQIGDYNVCFYVEGTDSTGTELNAENCTQVHIDQYPQNLNFDWTPLLPLRDENVELTASAQDNGTLTYDWNLGDGNTATGNPITHSWDVGEYNVCVTVTDDVGLSKTTCKTVPVFAYPTIHVTMKDTLYYAKIEPDSRLQVVRSEWNTTEGNWVEPDGDLNVVVTNPPEGNVYYILYYDVLDANRELNDPIPYLDFNYTVTVGFHPTTAEENISVNWKMEANVSCSFQAFDTNKSWTGGPTGEHNDTWAWKEGPELSITVACKDDLNNSADYTLTQAVLVYKIIPEDEETGVYDLNLWGDVQTGEAPLFRFIATDKEFNTSYVYEDINETLWLVLLPEKEWFLRFEEHFSDQVIINTYDLPWSPWVLPICVSPDKPNIYQTAYSSVPIEDKAFGITRAETGCIRAIRQTEYVEGGYGFHFYTQAGQYAVWLIDKNWETRTLLGSFFGDTKTVIDLEKLLLLLQKAEKIPFPPYSVLEVKKVEDENATQFIYQTNEVLKEFELNVYRAGEDDPFFTQKLTDPGNKIRIVMYWAPYNLKPEDVLIVKWRATYPDGRYEDGEKKTTPTGRLILFLWWQALAILIVPALILFMRTLSLNNVIVFSALYIVMAILILPYTEFTPVTQMLGIMGVVALIILAIILRKVG